jgi:hydroxymethylpyrimidine pyrophosphatase-like HAD family hydrolase
MTLRALYVDLDGTLLGRGAALLRDGEGRFSMLGARALEACARADVEVVLYSGRRRSSMVSDARLLGCPTYIFEAGCGLVIDGELEWLTGDLLPREDATIHAQIAASGAPELLLTTYAGRLEYHDPWHLGRDVSHVFRGDIDAREADELLLERGFGQLRLVDNGMIDLPGKRAYHLIPRVASKGRAVARHMQVRGYAREECIAVGDSREDLTAAEAVETFWFVANAIEQDPTIREALAAVANARVAEACYGAGVYEALITTLAQRRGSG